MAASSGHLPVSGGVVAQQDAGFADRSRCPRRPTAPAPTRPDGPRRLTSRPVPERCSRRISPATALSHRRLFAAHVDLTSWNIATRIDLVRTLQRDGGHDLTGPRLDVPCSPPRRYRPPGIVRPTGVRSRVCRWRNEFCPGDVARGTAGCPAVGPIGGETGVRVMEAGGQKPKPATAQPGLACASRAQPMHVSIAARTSWSMASRWSVVVACHSAKAWAHSFGDHSP